ncbi:serine hydrolase domain-containing protein [Bacteroidota bacterium]
MKSRYIILTALCSVLMCSSCTEEIIKPVGTCTFTETTGNATNPYNNLYQQILDDFVAMGIPGISIAIETPELGWWVGCTGMACIEDAEVLEPCHLFNSASMAKPYTATMIMRLYEDGIIGLDDLISDYLPEEMINQIANGDVATIRHCLSHTAGFWDIPWGTNARTAVLNNPQIDLTLEEQFEKYFYGRPAFAAPGEKFHYSNAGFSILGMIIDEVCGMTLGEYFEQEIVVPLGLVNTHYKASPGYPDIDGLVNGYIEHYPGKLQNCSDLDRNRVETSMGSGGVIATPYEFARFYQELIRGNILDPATLDVMLTEHIKMGGTFDYGYCLGMMRDSLDHGFYFLHQGMINGSLSNTGYFPESDITYSILTNLGGVFETSNQERFENLRKEIINGTFTGSRD